MVIRVTGSSLGPDTTYHFVGTPSYEISDGNRIVFRNNCPPGADCIANDTGRVVQGGLRIWSLLVTGTWAPWIYTRIGD